MKVIIKPHELSGEISAIESKSHVHRLLICSALAKSSSSTFLPCRVISKDIAATANCLNSLGADIKITDSGLLLSPIGSSVPTFKLDCGESGSTYRFLVPVAAALGQNSEFILSGRLHMRPMDELFTVLENHGVIIEGKGSANISVKGVLTPGKYEISGGVSSQFISGLLLALPMLKGDSELIIKGTSQSVGYINLTLSVIGKFGIRITPTANGFIIPGRQKYIAPDHYIPEGDWSNSAFWLCAAAMRGDGITVRGLETGTAQGDSEICEILSKFGAVVNINGTAVSVRPGKLHGITLDAGNIPDLVPAIAALACAAEGITVIENIGRLRLKESDRISSVTATINSLGGHAVSEADKIIITGIPTLSGGCTESFGDHRIAMMAAVASVVCREPVIITGAEAADKSYPDFFCDFSSLGGIINKGDDTL